MRIIGNDPSVPRQTQEVASGTLPNGKPVVVNADGTVSAVAETTASAGSLTALNSAGTGSSPVAVAFDSSNNKFVVAYADGFPNGVGKAQVGTVSGTSISFGSAATFEANEAKSIAMTFDSTNNKIVIAFKDGNNSSYGTAIVGTVSGTSISFGTQVVFNSGNTTQIVGVHDTNAGKTVIAYRDDANSDQGTAIVGTVSGTSISFGSETIFNTGNTYYTSIAFDSDTNKVIIAYADYGNSIHGTAVVGTVSGTSISFGSEVVFAAASTAGYTGTAYDTNNNKVVIAFRDADNSAYGTAIVGTVSGTSISFGSEVVFAAHSTTRINCSYSSSNGKIIIFYGDGSSSNAIKVIEGTVSGTSISFGSAVEVTANNGEYLLSACDNNNHAVVAFNNNNNSVYATAAVFSSSASTLTSENYIGIARSGAADTKGAIINTQGAIADIPAINYNLDFGSYDNKNFNVGSNINDIAINNDGTKIYYVIDGGSAVQRTLSTAFDISTAGSATSYNATGQDNDPRDVTFKTDGTKMYITASQNNKIYQYSLSSAFDVTSASYDSKSVSAAVGYAYSTQFKSDGTKMYVAESSSGTYYIVEYTLSTPWDVSTASYTSNSFNVSSQSNALTGLFLRPDGTEIFGASQNDRKILQYNFGTAFDVSTLSYSNTSLNVSTQVGGSNSIKGVMFSSDGDKMYVGGVFATDTIYQYSTTSAFTPAQSYYVQKDGTLGTTAADPSVFAGTAVSATKLIVKG